MHYSGAGVKWLPVSNRLSTTSYAVLSLLALRSWTGSELTQQARRSLAHCWPKEDSVLYEEPRRLVARGLARAHREHHRGRTRNRYAIAEQGELPDAQAAVAALRDWAVALRADGVAVLRGYQAGEAPFPERLHINV